MGRYRSNWLVSLDISWRETHEFRFIMVRDYKEKGAGANYVGANLELAKLRDLVAGYRKNGKQTRGPDHG